MRLRGGLALTKCGAGAQCKGKPETIRPQRSLGPVDVVVKHAESVVVARKRHVCVIRDEEEEGAPPHSQPLRSVSKPETDANFVALSSSAPSLFGAVYICGSPLRAACRPRGTYDRLSARIDERAASILARKRTGRNWTQDWQGAFCWR